MSSTNSKEDSFRLCPYNKAHQILESRMQFHLIKCSKQYSMLEEKSICPFDATHHVNKAELTDHVKTCPNRIVIESHSYNVGDNPDETIDLHQNVTVASRTESWDNEENDTYDPTKKLDEKPIMRALEGATKSQRKAFRNDERSRIQDLKKIKEKSDFEKRKNPNVLNVDITFDEEFRSSNGGKRLRPPSQSSLNQALQRSQEIALSHHNAIDKAKANVSARLENSFSKLKEEHE